jgi:hypothetical protein
MKKYLLFILAVLFLISHSAHAAEEARTFQGIEVLTGYGWGDLKRDQEYCLFPLVLDLDFNLKKLTRKIGLNPPILMQFQLEPYISGVSSPNANVEVGSGFALKFGLLPESFALQPYIKAACGMLYMSQHTLEQSTQFNFYEYGGAGAHWYFNQHWGLTVEYRFRHLSNSGIRQPNSGINNEFVLGGVTYKF